MRKKINVSQSFVKKWLPKRATHAHKGDGGKVCIIGGGKGLYGAGILSALAATRCGAGYTHLMTDLTNYPWIKFPDFILHPVRISELKKLTDSAVGIGPGLGINKRTQGLIKTLLRQHSSSVILDADALSVLATMNCKLPAHWILTPHEGELARLLGMDSKHIKKDRMSAAIKAQEKYGCVILLKGAETIVVDHKRLAVVKKGSPALAKAGTGDVLLGMISAFCAQNIPAFEAAVLASTVHGQASLFWMAQGNDHLSLRPLDLIETLSATILSLRS